MVEIELSKGRVALVDDVDAALVSPHKWYCRSNRKGKLLAYALIDGVEVAMHRLIKGQNIKTGFTHMDDNGLNNIRSNIVMGRNNYYAPVSKIKDKDRDPKTYRYGYKGVAVHMKYNGKVNKRYYSYVRHAGVSTYVGCFGSAREAAVEHDLKAVSMYGDEVVTNVMLGLLEG